MHPWLDLVAFYLSEASADPGDFGVLAQYGVLGIVCAGLIVFARVSYKRETDRSDRLETEVIRLNNLIIDRAIPALTAAAQAAEDATMLLRDLQREREMDRYRRGDGDPPRRKPRPEGDDL